jgi:hypothetical protein
MYKNNTWLYIVLISVSFFPPQTILAQDKGGIRLKLGMGHFSPELELKILHADNLLLAPDRKQETWVSVISPKLTYEIASHKNRFIAAYLLRAGFHENSSSDDYVDNRVRVEYQYTPTSRVFTALRGEYLDSHDPRGTFRTEGVTATLIEAEPDEWHHWGIEGKAAYGRKNAKGHIEADLGYIDKTYDNNRADTFVRDGVTTYGAARFFYRIRPKTRIVLEARARDFNYDEDAPGSASLDSIDSTLFAGVIWKATYKTTRYAKIGFINKDFDSSRRADDDNTAWEVGVEWRPRTYSIFSLNTSRSYQETNGTGDFILNDQLKLGWAHVWGSRFSTRVEFTYAEDGFGLDAREDESFRVEGHVDYKMRRWFDLRAGYRYIEKDSNDNSFDYDQNLFEFTARITL